MATAENADLPSLFRRDLHAMQNMAANWYGKSWPESGLTFSGKATKSVSVTWDAGTPGHIVNAWIQLQVISPNKLESTKTTFILRCE